MSRGLRLWPLLTATQRYEKAVVFLGHLHWDHAGGIAPGLCWEDDESLAIASIRKLKALAASEKADLWPNHDFEAYRSWPPFPEFRS